MPELTKHEETILISILNLKENAYGVFIRRKIRETTGRQWNYGTLYRILDQLVKKEMLVRREGEPLSEKGGRRKIFYSLTADGVEALKEAYEMQTSLWGENTKEALDKA